MFSLDDLFQRLSQSPFRQRFHLGSAEYRYFLEKGEETLGQHALEFIRARLAPAEPVNDGKQTPMRGHPVFIAQHATATCCRGCLSKWHNIAAHQPMSVQQQEWVKAVIIRWLKSEMLRPQPPQKRVKKPGADNSGQLELL
ncbi:MULTISPECIES: DUF4186 domain-containing protein [Erwinia]|uniref:DUF4186 domain-containing protein n=1 Tax=Erwinia TaxID=551 RepID=UPI00105BC13A|nr:DUF4186 domain-containing protein [Erwinia aphidicola]MCP2232405.1 hypothetical protein [Erwinia aphidicola]